MAREKKPVHRVQMTEGKRNIIHQWNLLMTESRFLYCSLHEYFSNPCDNNSDKCSMYLFMILHLAFFYDRYGMVIICIVV